MQGLFCSSFFKSLFSLQDTPGFIVNRLLLPYQAEALRMVERGDATAEGRVNRHSYLPFQS